MMLVERRTAAVAVLACMIAMNMLPAVGNADGLDGAEPVIWPIVVASAWTDPLDDLGHVYVPQSGLAGVEVTGGEARLLPGTGEGWIASEVIECPGGHRYDLVLLEALTPGGSRVEISILDATEEAAEVGFANGTIEGYKRVEGTELIVYGLPMTKYPEVRIQVNLVANGTHRPALLGWSMHFTGIEEWHDDLVGTAKILDQRGVNLTHGAFELNLTTKSGGGSGGVSSTKFPTFVTTMWGYTQIAVFKVNDQGNGYEDAVPEDANGTRGMAFDDLNNDGNLDLVCANGVVSSTPMDSQILWGDGTDTWSLDNAQELNVQYGSEALTGDFNGDGERDILITSGVSSVSPCRVFLNQGGGAFNYDPDITINSMMRYQGAVGDLNNDGYDDFVVTTYDEADGYYGGPEGPDDTMDLDFPVGWSCGDVEITDIDDDGYLDVLIACAGASANSKVFLGGADGPDVTPDVLLPNYGGDTAMNIDHGDLNGDGHNDIVVCIYSGGSSDPMTVTVFPGTASGWSVDDRIDDIIPEWWTHATEVLDVDQDGYDDIVVASSSTVEIFAGGITIATEPTYEVTCPNNPTDIEFAVGDGPNIKRKFAGSVVWMPIQLPEDKRWDIVSIEGTFPPHNTTVLLSVLGENGKPIDGYRDLETTSVDLSGLTDHRTIQVRVTIGSDRNDTTPVIDRLTVKWMDLNVWREEFYGDAKVARTVGLDIVDGLLLGTGGARPLPQLLFSSLRDDMAFDPGSLMYHGSRDQGYLASAPVELGTRGAAAVAAGDVNGDGLTDLLFATHQTSDTNFMARSPLFLGTPVGWRSAPDHEFPTVGASDVLMEDLNGDGHTDVVFAQERREADDHMVNSTLFWGSADGWNATPDVEFATTGATGAVATDLDGDGLLDLVFSCYKAASTTTWSRAYAQTSTGFDGSTPSWSFQTKGARGVAAGDVDGNGDIDLVFANSFSGGFAEIDSYVFLSPTSGGGSPLGIPTSGATDVKLADVDGDGDLDIVFANGKDDLGEVAIGSYVYLNDGTGSFSTVPDFELPTVGASAVAVADIDGEGWMDLVFACHFNGTGYQIGSRAFLGGASGWGAAPTFVLPTTGASDVMVGQLLRPDMGAYLSEAITVDFVEVGAFDTFLYTATLGAAQDGQVQIVDALTWEVLTSTPIAGGQNSWSLAGDFWVKEHPSIRVMVTVAGLEEPGSLELDNLWLNWTERRFQPPEVLGLELSQDRVLRTKAVEVAVEVSDEFDPAHQLTLVVEHRLEGTEEWGTSLLGHFKFSDGAWRATARPRVDCPVGVYTFRAKVTDSDAETSGYVEFPGVELEVLNNLPTTPEVQLLPARPVTTSTLTVDIVHPSTDVESGLITYTYRWYRNGVLVPDITGDTVAAPCTHRGDNWTVEVAGFDGEDEGAFAVAWRVVQNANPVVKNPIADPEFPEDTIDTNWIDLSTAFEDPDGDALTWAVDPAPVHMTVTIDQGSGRVTLVPDENWNGDETLTFVASDGELQAAQTVTVHVTAVNDVPRFVTVDGAPILSDPVEYTVKQGALLVIRPGVIDVEGDELVFIANSSAVIVDDMTGEVRFEPDNDDVGTLRFALRVYDVVSPDRKVSLNFTITVEDENDPMDDPRITNPADGAEFKANTTFYLTVVCHDPDAQHGQVLNYTWTSNVSGLLGYGSSLTLSLQDAGVHLITLTVTDGKHQKTDTIQVTIRPREVIDPDPGPGPNGGDDGGDDGVSIGLMAAIAVLVAAGAVGAFVVTKRREDGKDAELDEELGPEEMDEEQALVHMARAVKASADALEGSRNGGHDVEAWVEADAKEDVEISTTSTPGASLSIEARVTEETSEDIATLWEDIEEGGSRGTDGDADGNGNGVMEADKDALRLESLKRQYHNAISRLPYGIPSKELRDMDWVDLSNALATGKRKQVEGGREVALIGGRWYYSDHEDTGTFLKEHGARPKEEARGGKGVDVETLMAKLEERFILGDVSEETYLEIKQKYEKV